MDAFGVIEETISIDVYDVPTETLEKIGLAYLLENVQPKIIRTVEQSAYRAFPVQFDHIGSRVTLPDTTTGIVLSRTYADDFGMDYHDGNIESTLRVQVLDSTGIGLIDITTEFLLYDNGNYLTLDSGVIVEAS